MFRIPPIVLSLPLPVNSVSSVVKSNICNVIELLSPFLLANGGPQFIFQTFLTKKLLCVSGLVVSYFFISALVKGTGHNLAPKKNQCFVIC
jgi:hypothetical protein